MYLLIDNYDSFTFNLYQFLLEVGAGSVKVFRNDRITIQEIEGLNPEGIIISPGPGRPEDAGIIVEMVKHFAGRIPILGVCLGHQAIGYAFGGRIKAACRIVHGKAEEIHLDGKGLFRNIPSPSLFTRYHSLVIDPESLPGELEVTATSKDGEIMGVRHKSFIIEGIQFHPESVASEYGKKLLRNFLKYRRDPFNHSLCLEKLTSGKDLQNSEAASFMDELTEGELTDAQIGALLAAFKSRPLRAKELAAMGEVIMKKRKGLKFDRPLLDTCGTGGDGKGSFNISSMAALLCSACGVFVAKHGNRGVSSSSGSADFFSAIGIPVELQPDQALRLLEKTGFTFLFAPLFHSSMKHVAQVRRELGIKTIMNVMGPLLNPAEADYQLIGVYSEELCRPVAEAMGILGKKRVLVVHGLDGLDEISVSAPTLAVELDKNGSIKEFLIDPTELKLEGFPTDFFPEHSLRGGSPSENALIALRLFGIYKNNDLGKQHSSINDVEKMRAIKEAVLLNAGAALYVYGSVKDIREGYLEVAQAFESGRGREKLEEIISEANLLNK